MGTLRGIIRDSASGEPVEAKVHVLTSNGGFVHPVDAILKVGRSGFKSEYLKSAFRSLDQPNREHFPMLL